MNASSPLWRMPAIWGMGLIIIIITIFVVGTYTGLQQMGEPEPTVAPARGSVPEWMLNHPTCGVIPLLPCPETEGVTQ